MRGDTSRTADLSLLQQAKQLDEQGANSEEIRQKTGWFKGYDGMWRYEIDDSAAEIKDIAKFSVNFDLSNIGKEYNLPDIRYATNYLDTNEEKATIIAVPYVIKRGIEIGKHNNHKSRQKQTITFAAPVELNGQTGHMAVVVNLNGNHYYVSRIINPDGSAFIFNKNEVEQESYRGVRNNASLADTTSSTSTTNIPNNSPNVNPKSENNQNISSNTTQQSQSGDTPADITLAAGVFHADKHFTNPARDLFR